MKKIITLFAITTTFSSCSFFSNAVGLDVQKNEIQSLPLEVIQGIEEGWQELREGKGIPSSEVHQKARLLCTSKYVPFFDNRDNPEKLIF